MDSQKLQEFISNNKSLLEEKRLVLEKQDDVTDKNRVNELFDPNIESKEQLIHKGLSKRVVNNIINYRNKGGSFKVKKDLVRLYSLSEMEYQKLKPFIALPDTLIMKSNNNFLNRKPKQWVISINSCSADSLEKLMGIGPVLAKRIVAFRSKLGGFYSLTQLNEVYGLPVETIEIILPHLILDTTQIKKIKLNEMGADEMAKHPYLSSNEAKAIVSYRNQHGKFLQLSALKSLHIFREKSINRLLPYFDLN
ncbi:MAG: helix-hairpin-helix domain-containing protein [Bacteroidia bacterium]|nr:helix-hairpin-helix domain-containing protein [Bacteroidia bacterium]